VTAAGGAVAAASRSLGTALGSRRPRLALILGSGLGALAARISPVVDVEFADIPGFPPAGVQGHAGRIIAGSLEEVDVFAVSGRWHLYEGHHPAIAALPVRVAYALGARTLLVSNAAGGIRRSLQPGDLMIIRDHINLMWRNPLSGPVAPYETRFPDMSAPYDRDLAAVLRAAAAEGRLGADAVGMSTVPEVLAARALGMRVAGISLIANPAAGLGAPLDHDEVLAAGAHAAAAFERLVRTFVARASKGSSER
jgi:purine-nucleoside phosphorylase